MIKKKEGDQRRPRIEDDLRALTGRVSDIERDTSVSLMAIKTQLTEWAPLVKSEPLWLKRTFIVGLCMVGLQASSLVYNGVTSAQVGDLKTEMRLVYPAAIGAKERVEVNANDLAKLRDRVVINETELRALRDAVKK